MKLILNGKNMKKQITIIRIFSGVLIAGGILPLALFWKGATPQVISYLVFNAIVTVVISVGLIRLMPWARWAAILFLILGCAKSLFGALRDIKFMISKNIDIIAMLPAVTIVALLFTICTIVIWWLCKYSTRTLFSNKRIQQGA
jgi:hypothetical protein